MIQNLRRGLIWYSDADLNQELNDEELKNLEFDPGLGAEYVFYIHNHSERTAVLNDRSNLDRNTFSKFPYEIAPHQTAEVRLIINQIDNKEEILESYQSQLSAEVEWR